MPYTSSAGSSGVAHLAAQFGVPVIASGIQDFRDLAAHEGIAMRFFTPGDLPSLAETMLRTLTSPADLADMAWQSHNAAIAMSMPRVVQEYVRTFRHQRRVETVRFASNLRRRSDFDGKDHLSRSLGKRIQSWQDEEEMASKPSA